MRSGRRARKLGPRTTPGRLLVLCPFGRDYSEFYEKKLDPIIRGYTGNKTPLRMLDLRSPRLVGQALYQQIRWSSRCLVDWTDWRPNVFFELGVRLACSEYDPLCIIQRSDAHDSSDPDGSPSSSLRQHDLLQNLLEPKEYDRARPREALEDGLALWRGPLQMEKAEAPSGRVLPPAATFAMAQASFQWQRKHHAHPTAHGTTQGSRADPRQGPREAT